MRPRKKDRTVKEDSRPKCEQIQADHELFLQIFEKPTQIYRYLRARNLVSPIFLQRTLSYQKGRCARRKNTRENFNIDSLLEVVEAKKRKSNNQRSYKPEFMNLTFIGFFDKGCTQKEPVEVEVSLLKYSHKKRKNVTAPFMTVNLGKACVPCNPELSSPSKVEAMAVGSDNFIQHQGSGLRSYILRLRIIVTAKERQDDVFDVVTPSRITNGNISSPEDDGPPAKRRRSTRSSVVSSNDLSLNNSISRKSSGNLTNNNTLNNNHCDETKIYRTELVVYDKHMRCQLTEGDYEVAVEEEEEEDSEDNTKKTIGTWETFMDGKPVGPFEVFHKMKQTLKFKLSWNKAPIQGSVDSPRPIRPWHESVMAQNHFLQHRLGNGIEHKDGPERKSNYKRRRVFYQFLYNNNTRQQTEARDDLRCPWCLLHCLQLYCLLKHLRSCHPRFNFTYVEHNKGARIDVSINECYDGSYAGNPQDFHSIGMAFSRNGPVRRTPVSQVLTYRPKKPTFDVSEFAEQESDNLSRNFIQGHNRLYYHTSTTQPIKPQEIDVDSENEVDPPWLRQKTVNLIDEFTDVNEGEKELMKLWNLHVMHHNYLADCQMPTACTTFVEEHGQKIIKQDLIHNLIVHLSNLCDFGLIKQEFVFKTTMKLYQLRSQIEEDDVLSNDNLKRPPIKGHLSKPIVIS